MTEELSYQSFFRGLNQFRIDYLVVGGLAVNFHGVPRMTYDIDLMILLERSNILRLIQRLGEWGYRPKMPIDAEELADEAKREMWVGDKGMKAFTFWSDVQPIGEVDVLIDYPLSYEELKARAEIFIVERQRVPVISIKDLIALKVQSGRRQDLSDVEHLLMILEK